MPAQTDQQAAHGADPQAGRQPDALSLVADVGGTNTRVALARGPALVEGSIRRYANAALTGLDAGLAHYLDQMDNPACQGACVAVAGPVRAGAAHLTNRDWTIDEDMLRRVTGAPVVAVINDLQAQGQALGHIAPEALADVFQGQDFAPTGQDAMLVVGVGTGFNCAPVHPLAQGRLVAAAEAGHASLPSGDRQLCALADFARAETGFASVEDALSGRGLERLYRFCAHERGAPASATAAQIVEAAQAGDALGSATVELAARVLGVVLGDLALIHLPFGGIFLSGGVARALTPWLSDGGLAQAFVQKGRFAPLMQDFRIQVIEDDYAALSGCAHLLADLQRPG